MKIRVGSTMGRNAKPIYIHASAWPREKAASHSAMGGLATAHTTLAQHASDLEEVKAYMSKHLKASVSDIAMECNMSRSMAGRLMGEAWSQRKSIR
jgi:hypothetical protein